MFSSNISNVIAKKTPKRTTHLLGANSPKPKFSCHFPFFVVVGRFACTTCRSKMGGCIASREKPLSPQEMQEKQREIMLQRQREFEKKREFQQQKQSNNNIVAQGSTSSASSTPRNSKKLLKPVPEPEQQQPETPEIKEKPAATITPVSATTTPVKDTMPVATTPVKETPPPVVQETSPKPLPTDEFAALDASLVEKRTLDANDASARRSKNVHDLAMYGKDVTRRASFNPRPKESPFTPEMQAAMRKGHEEMVLEEERKKQERMLNAALVKEEGDAEDEGFSFGKEEEKQVEVLPEREDNDNNSDVDETVIPVANAKFTVQNPQDRLSKNAHDMSQYMNGAKNFNRRLSFQSQQLQQ